MRNLTPLFLLLCSAAFSQITFDASSTSLAFGFETPSSPHTIGTCANRVLVVGLITSNYALPTGSVTFNGVSLTLGASNSASVSWQWNQEYQHMTTSFFYMVNPPSGTYNISTNGNYQGRLPAASFCGVDQTSPIHLTSYLELSVNTITPTVDGTYIFEVHGMGKGVNPSTQQPGAGWAARVGGLLPFADSYGPAGYITYKGPITPAGPASNTWGAFSNSFDIMVALKPFSASVTKTVHRVVSGG